MNAAVFYETENQLSQEAPLSQLSGKNSALNYHLLQNRIYYNLKTPCNIIYQIPTFNRQKLERQREVIKITKEVFTWIGLKQEKQQILKSHQY